MVRVYRERTVDVIKGMKAWRKYGEATTLRGRNKEQKAFDSGVLACSEFIRRFTGDESLALQCHALLTPTDVDSIGFPINEIKLKKEGGSQ